ncbi:MAG: tetratricopeptide repeat-containing protein [Cyclobacteriaceae bacterium]
MNKQKFVDLLRQPESVSDSNLSELEEMVSENPYFHSAHTVIARASKLLKSPQTGKRINTAAIYATSRKALKSYITGSTQFGAALAAQVAEAAPAKEEKITPKVEEKAPEQQPEPAQETSKATHMSESEHDTLIDEVYSNIEEWRKSRNQFLDYELSVEETPEETSAKAVPAPEVKEDKSNVDKIKNQIAEEIIAEEEEVEQAIQGINKEIEEEGEEPELESDEADSGEKLSEITKQKEKLKLSPGNKGGKKFRLNILNRPTSKTKAKSTAKKESTAKASAEKKTTTEKKTTATKKAATPAKKTTAASKTTATRKTTTAKKATSTTKKATTAKSTSKSATTAKSTPKLTAKRTTKISATKKTTAKGTTKAKTTKGTTKKSDTEDGEKKKPKEALASSKNTSSKKEQENIIDQFISTNPSIGSLKADPADGEVYDLTERSNEFPEGVATENIAQIFESQGKVEKAISIYEQLILINPEKKSYFATRIKNLKKI